MIKKSSNNNSIVFKALLPLVKKSSNAIISPAQYWDEVTRNTLGYSMSPYELVTFRKWIGEESFSKPSLADDPESSESEWDRDAKFVLKFYKEVLPKFTKP
jgi:hypothetical protein